MKASEYIKKAIRTEPKKYSFKGTGDITPRIEHGAVGIATESGEIMNSIKTSKYYGRKLDKINLIEEMGDVMWYLAILCDELNVSFEEVWDKNIRKLTARFPEKFSHNKANRRDLKKERLQLEK